MSTNVTWNGNTYSIPASGETGWSALSSFLLALGNGAAIAEEMKQAIRVATTTPVTVSDTTDCVIAVNRSVAGATTVNLPAGTDGRWFVICDQKADAATNNITVTPNGAETINGSATYVMSQNNEAIIIAYSVSNTRWNVVARFTSGAPLSNPMATTGDMIYGGASGVATKLATGATTGLLHGGNGAVPTWALLVNADISASAAIAGSKIAAATSTVTGTLSYEGATTYSNGGTTLTWTNTSAPATYTFIARRTGSIVCITFVFATTTVSSGSFIQIGNIASDFRPATTKYTSVAGLNGPTNNTAIFGITTAGNIAIYKDANFTTWTIGNTCNTGTFNLTVTYSID